VAGAAPLAYTITDLGTLGGHSSAATAINDAGQVVGESQTAEGSLHPFLWERGVMTDLGTLPDATAGRAAAISAAGQVVGYVQGPGPLERACLWEQGSLTDLWFGQALAINAAGQVVGTSVPSSNYDFYLYRRIPQATGRPRAVLWQQGELTDLGDLGGDFYTTATGINTTGQVVGYGTTGLSTGGAWHAFLWADGVMTSLGTLGGRSHCHAHAINDAGQVVGAAFDAQMSRNVRETAFIWQQGEMTDLGALSGAAQSWARAINASGHVVGEANADEAALWEDGVMSLLTRQTPGVSSRGWERLNPGAINGVGQIAGWGRLNGQQRAFLLTPVGGRLPRTGGAAPAPIGALDRGSCPRRMGSGYARRGTRRSRRSWTASPRPRRPATPGPRPG
jgi:probable HAF family extracellular repeat protein